MMIQDLPDFRTLLPDYLREVLFAEMGYSFGQMMYSSFAFLIDRDSVTLLKISLEFYDSGRQQ